MPFKFNFIKNALMALIIFFAINIYCHAETAEDYLKSGISYYEQLNYAQALSDLNKAIDLNPNSSNAYMYRGAVQNDNNLAISDFNKAIDIDPKNSEAYFYRGKFYYRSVGNFTKAMSDFNKEIELNPNHAGSYYFRGSLYEKKNYGLLKNFKRWVGLSDPDFDVNEIKALSDYSKAIEIDPNDRQAYLERAMCYSSLKDFDKAWADIHTVEKSGMVVDPWYINSLKKASGRDQ